MVATAFRVVCLCFQADAAHANAIPDDDERNGNGKNQRGDGVDFRRDAAAEAAPDFERKRVVAADQEKGDGDFVHRKREDEQAGGDQRELEIRQRDAPEGLPGRGAEIERGFFLGAIDFLQAGEKFGGGDGDEGGAVAEKNGEQAELQAGEDGEHQQGETGDDAGKNEREENEAAEERFAGKAGAIERERGEQAERERKSDGAAGDDEAVEDGIPDGAVGEELAIPIEREMLRRKSADTVAIEGIENEHDDRQIDEREDERGVDREQGRAASWRVAAHLKDQRFSRRSVRKSSER